MKRDGLQIAQSKRWKYSTIIRRFIALSVLLFCGCATESSTTLDHYHWAPDFFAITFPSGGWRYVNSFTSNGEHHEFFEHQSLFRSSHSEQVSASSYVPTRVGAESASINEVFKNVTNFLSQSYSLSVVIVENKPDSLTWEWNGISKGKLQAESGVEKIIRGTGGMYRLRYVCSAASLSPRQRRAWIPIIKDAELLRRGN